MKRKISSKLLKDLFLKLPSDPFSETLPQTELENLFFIKTEEHLPSGLAEKIERIITLRKETVYIEVLMAMAERRLSHYIENRQKYPSMKNNFDEKIEEVRKYIEDLKKLKKNFFSPE